eukprot:1288335-Pyramimonas_sp.AAC.1
MRRRRQDVEEGGGKIRGEGGEEETKIPSGPQDAAGDISAENLQGTRDAQLRLFRRHPDTYRKQIGIEKSLKMKLVIKRDNPEADIGTG